MKSSHASFWKGVVVVTDPAWGDNGKGKVIDVASEYANVVVRYNGGPNAGHTVRNSYGEFGLHLVPSGIFHPKVINIISTKVVVNPFSLVEEIENLQKKGVKISGKNLLVSEGAHLIMPWHRKRDTLAEKTRGGSAIGTTGQGIGPAYEDRASRKGLRVGDLLRRNFEELFDRELVWQERLTRVMDGNEAKNSKEQYYDRDHILKDFKKVRALLSPMIKNTLEVIWKNFDAGKNILGEAGQGALLDLDLGGYPFVTSSNPGVAGFSISTGISAKHVNKVIGVLKAYTTRVGGGPMPTELHDEIGEHFVKEGREFGVTTGRRRRCGWIDIPAMKYGARVAGVDRIAMTKLDILDKLKEVKICVGYTVNGKKYKDITTFDPEFISRAKPILEKMKGWQEDTSKIRDIKKLPKNAKKYIERVEALLGLPINIVSVGPDREETMYRK